LELSPTTLLYVSFLVLVIAALYSSVGHGGASGYLAVLSFFSVSPDQMASTALILNVIVSGIATFTFVRAGYFSARLFWPFAVTSIPLAFLGGFYRISDPLYYLLLAFALLIASFRLSMPRTVAVHSADTRPLHLAVAFPMGGAVGLLSGMVGIGGGIFLSPVMMLLRWATAKETAAVAAVFILVNSLAGIGGRMTRGGLDLLPTAIPLLAAVAGGLLGSYLGAHHFTSLSLRRVLAVVLILAAIKLTIAAL
jgi:hypothetical protein